VTGNVLDPTDAGLQSHDGGFDIVHTASLFHLFGWDDQVCVGERIERFFKSGAKAWCWGGRAHFSDGPCVQFPQIPS
jgi:hypothetical protein